MYRYIVDNAITFTPDDLVLFRESPFAVWMERLTLENPDHGIPPDLDSIGSYPQSPQQNDIVATLRAEGRNVALINPEHDEPGRRIATLEAMRNGADFIVNGQLAVDALSGAVDLLMRTSGFSELGDFLYIPCETRIDNSLQSPFRLCFAADLLADLQGQMPAQMLIIRGGAEVVPLQTEDHIYYYRAVQKRFLSAMSEFRKHRMPDPSESMHFGRWAECASEVLKQRALSEQSGDQQIDETPEQEHEQVVEMPQLRVASSAGATAPYDTAPYDMDSSARSEYSTAQYSYRSDSGSTLAEQASQLKPGSYRSGKPPGHTPSLARIGKPLIVPPAPTPAQPAADDTLENLEFIGSRASGVKVPDFELSEVIRPAPAPNLRGTSSREMQSRVQEIKSGATRLPEREPRPPVFLPPEQPAPEQPAPTQQLHTQLPTNEDVEVEESGSVIDMDSAPASSLAPVVQRAEAVFKRLIRDDPMFKKVEPTDTKSFSNSLNTSEEFNES